MSWRSSGPKVDAQVSLDDPQTTFFRDPATHRAVTDIFALRTEVGASSNYAKFAYVSPALFGAQLALSFTPSQGKNVLPFLHAGPHVPGRQADIWEAGAALFRRFRAGDADRLWRRRRRPGRAQIAAARKASAIWAAGLRADYPVNDDISLSLGGAYRQSNAYAFDINRSYQAAPPRAAACQRQRDLRCNGWRGGVWQWRRRQRRRRCRAWV